jgi:hypothetical protein
MKVLLHGLYLDSKAYADYVSRGFEENVGIRNVSVMVPNIYKRDAEGSRFSDRLVDIGEIDKFDLIVLSYHSLFDTKLTEVLNSNTSATKIYIDQEDNFFIKNIANHKEIKYYFKRELYQSMSALHKLEWTIRYVYGNYWVTYKGNRHRMKIKHFISPLFQPCGYAVQGRNQKVKPFPLAYTPTVKSPPKVNSNRKYDLSLIANPQNIGERKKVYRFALGLKDSFPESDFLISKGGYSKEEYLNILADSKSSVSVRGYGYDTYRYWEIAYHGAMLISQRLPIVIPDNFIDDTSAIFFSRIDELREKFKKTVVDSNEWQEIARSAQKRYLKYHTAKARIKNQILKYIK